MRTTPLKVFQFATGNVGSEMVHKTVQHPDLELIGLYCYSEDKVGRDAGEIAGIDPIGVLATNSVEDVIAAKPDCVTYFGVWPDIDLFCRLLESGINVVTTSDWITGHSRNQNHPHPSGRKPTELVDEAAKRGNATLYGTGMNPGLAQILAIVNTAGLSRIDHIQVIETVDVSCHHSVDTWKKHGYGRPVDDPEVPKMLEAGATVFADSIYMIADCCGIEIDEIAFECELGACKEEVDLGWWRLPKGSVGASLAKYIGKVKGEPKIEVHLEWQMTPNTEPKWNVQNCYIMTIRGNPQIMNRHMILPAMDSGQMDWSDPAYMASIGMTITGMPALNAIESVCEARPGLITSADLPLRAFAGRFHDHR
jgi:4-hydroxy-tetrahydrodipicolinate reductase